MATVCGAHLEQGVECVIEVVPEGLVLRVFPVVQRCEQSDERQNDRCRRKSIHPCG